MVFHMFKFYRQKYLKCFLCVGGVSGLYLLMVGWSPERVWVKISNEWDRGGV